MNKDTKNIFYDDYKPTNMSVINCNFCDTNFIFKEKIEPVKNEIKDIYYYNKEVDKLDGSFRKIKSKSSNITYTKDDPLLYSQTHNHLLELDRPPTNPDIKLKTLTTDKKLDTYGKKYKSYDNINSGFIKYYINNDSKYVYNEPLFSIESNVTGVLYTDPMGSIKPCYIRETESYDPINDVDNDELSWIRDSQYHREDILASQMSVINRRKWEPRWTNNIK